MRLLAVVIVLVACSSSTASPSRSSDAITPRAAATSTTVIASSTAAPIATPAPSSATATPTSITVPGVIVTSSIARPPAPRTTSDASMRTTTTTIAETAGTPITAAAPRQSGHTAYVLPVADIDLASWGQTHGRGYPATDIFVGCGASIVSPVTGVVLEVRRVDAYDPAVDNPATAGGLSISVLGDDGVRYYLAHFRLILDAIQPEVRVTAGQRLGEMGDTGRASACHVHFGLSPPCPGKEWSVRRGVIWPYPYLDAWRDGDQRSPADEVTDWLQSNPDACEMAMAEPNASDS